MHRCKELDLIPPKAPLPAQYNKLMQLIKDDGFEDHLEQKDDERIWLFFMDEGFTRMTRSVDKRKLHKYLIKVIKPSNVSWTPLRWLVIGSQKIQNGQSRQNGRHSSRRPTRLPRISAAFRYSMETKVWLWSNIFSFTEACFSKLRLWYSATKYNKQLTKSKWSICASMSGIRLTATSCEITSLTTPEDPHIALVWAFFWRTRIFLTL